MSSLSVGSIIASDSAVLVLDNHTTSTVDKFYDTVADQLGDTGHEALLYLSTAVRLPGPVYRYVSSD